MFMPVRFLPRPARRVAAAALLFCGASPALAAATSSWLVSGNLPRACAIAFTCDTANRCIQLRLSDRSTAQDTATVTWQCNFAVDSATMVFSSENQGVLRNPDDANPLPYLLSYTGGQGTSFVDQTLVTPFQTTAIPDTPNVDVTGILQVRVGLRTGNLFAGRYYDRVTVTITPNGL